MSKPMYELMNDIHERVVRIETKLEDVPEMKKKLEEHEREITKAKASMKTLKWIAGIFVVSIPAAVASFFRIFKIGA